MSERDALLSAILTDPDDDLARLVYADCLEETNRPAAVARARFIRLQVERAGAAPEDPFAPPTAPGTPEIDALAARWARVWLSELPAPVAKAVSIPRRGADAFRRGFVDGLTLGADVFLWHAPALFAAAPVTELHIRGRLRDLKAVLRSPYVYRLRALRLSGGWHGDQLGDLFMRYPPLGTVRDLDLSDCRLNDFGARQLATRYALSQLTVLRVRSNLLTEDGIDILASAPARAALAALTVLDVTDNPGVRTWTDPPWVRHGKRLVF